MPFNSIRVSRILFLFLLLFSSLSLAQISVVDEQIKKNIASTTAVITFLTSQESISTGIYRIGEENKKQSEFTAFKLPIRHKYRMHKDKSQYSMLMGYGRFDMNQSYHLNEGKATSHWEADSFSLGIGRSGELDIKHRWITSLELAYTKIQHDYKIPTSATLPEQTTTDSQFGNLHFNWHTDTVSLTPTLGLHMPLLPFLTDWYYEPRVILIHTESVLTNKPIENVSATSTLFDNKIDFGEAWHPKFDTWSLGLNPYVVRTDAAGTIGEGLTTYYWYRFGMNFKLHSKQKSWWDGLSYGMSYVEGQKFKGGQFLLTLDLGTLLTNLI